MDNKECCGTCRYHRYDSDYKDWLCTNTDAEYAGEFTSYDCVCEDHEERIFRR